MLFDTRIAAPYIAKLRVSCEVVPLNGIIVLLAKIFFAIGLGSVANSQRGAELLGTNTGRPDISTSSKVFIGFS